MRAGVAAPRRTVSRILTSAEPMMARPMRRMSHPIRLLIQLPKLSIREEAGKESYHVPSLLLQVGLRRVEGFDEGTRWGVLVTSASCSSTRSGSTCIVARVAGVSSSSWMELANSSGLTDAKSRLQVAVLEVQSFASQRLGFNGPNSKGTGSSGRFRSHCFTDASRQSQL